MARVIPLHWQSDIASGLPRRDRRSCEYEAYIPDTLAEREIVLDADVAADIGDAEAAITELNARHGVLADTEALARLLLRAEAVASSRIEGLEVGTRRLLQAEVARSVGDEATRDVTATEVLGNIESMAWATAEAAAGQPITRDFILEVHRRLLTRTDHADIAGQVRLEQNWIGGSSYNPCNAAFVPPPPEYVDDLLDDLAAFMSHDSLSPLTQAAIAHAQFETIHPFADGNGRVGRALVHVVLRRRGLAPRVVPPVSLVLATRSKDYINGLTETRYRGPATSKDALRGLNGWLATFASACLRAVQDVGAFEERIKTLAEQWRERLGQVRTNSAIDRLMTSLPGAPILTVSTAAALIDRSFQQTNAAMQRLEHAGIVRQTAGGKRNRAFEATEVIDTFTDLERQLASPSGDTRQARPVRRVPHRRRRQ